MTGTRFAAEVIVKGLFFLLFIGLGAWLLYFGIKRHRKVFIFIVISVAVGLARDIMSSPLLEPASGAFANVMVACADGVEHILSTATGSFAGPDDGAGPNPDAETDDVKTETPPIAPTFNPSDGWVVEWRGSFE